MTDHVPAYALSIAITSGRMKVPWLWWTLRAACPKRSSWRQAQFDTLRLHLVKLATTIVEKKTRIKMTLPTSCPRQSLIRFLFGVLAPPQQT